MTEIIHSVEHAYAEQLEADSAAQPAESHGIEIDADSAVQPGACLSIPNTSNENAPQATETLDAGTDTEAGEESLEEGLRVGAHFLATSDIDHPQRKDTYISTT